MDSRLRLLRPRSVAFVGGGLAPAAMAFCRDGGFAGAAYAVHPRREGAHRSVADLPEPPDAAFVAVNAEATIVVVRELAAIGAGGAICYAAGFAETGRDDLERELVAAAGAMPLLGPNCYGLIDRVDRVSLWPVPYALPPVERGVAMVLQSGNLGINVTMNQRSLPLAFVVSVGNQAGIDVAAAVELLAGEPEVTGIGIYLEGLRDVGAFIRAAGLAAERGVPIAVVKAGSSQLGARVTATHTSSVAGSDDVYDELFARLGVARCPSIPVLLETLKARIALGRLDGRRICVFTCSGGESALAADAAASAGLELPQPSTPIRDAIARELPPFAGVANPLDYNTALWGNEDALHRVFSTALRDPYDAALLVIDHPLPGVAYEDEVAAAIRALQRAAGEAAVPAAVASTLPESFPGPARERLLAAGTAPLQGLAEAFSALAACAAAPAAVPPTAVVGAGGDGVLVDEHAAKQILAAAGIDIPDGRLVPPAAAAATAAAIGFPVAVKLCSAALPHKAEAGALALGLRSEPEVGAAVAAMLAHVGDVPLAGVLVERMIDGAVAELLVGVKHEPGFGPVVIVGAGGSLVELAGDARVLLLPVSRDAAEAALRGLRLWPRIARGDVAATVDAVLAVARLAPTVAELDVNPLLVLAHGCVAADALVRR